MWEVIWDIYGTRDVFLAKSKKHHARLEAMPLEKRLSYSAIGGHGSLRFFRKMLGDMERYHKIVTLRDPIDRMISEYNYIRTRPQHPQHKVVAAGDFEDLHQGDGARPIARSSSSPARPTTAKARSRSSRGSSTIGP